MVHRFDITPCARVRIRGVALTLHKLLISAGVELVPRHVVAPSAQHAFYLNARARTACPKVRALFSRCNIFVYTLQNLDRLRDGHELFSSK